MTTVLRIEDITLVCDHRTYSYNFRSPLSILAGPIGTGKSSLLELLKYAMGGNAVLTSAVKSSVREVVARVEVGTEGLLGLTRSVDDDAGVVRVSRPDMPDAEFAVRPRAGSDTISDFLLGALGVPLVRVPRTRSRTSSETVPITFNDIYSYVYVEQGEIDRSIVHHLDSFREQKRRSAFELMFGLADPQVLEWQTELNEVKDAQKRQGERAVMLDAFLAETQVPGIDELVAELGSAHQDRDESDRALQLLAQSVSHESTQVDDLRRRLHDLEVRLQRAVEATDVASRELSMRETQLAQVELDQEREGRTRTAVGTLGSLAFVTCPQCLQEIEDARHKPGHCSLCLKALPRVSDASLDLEIDNLLEVEEDLGRLVEIARAAVTKAERAMGNTRAERDLLRSQLDRLSATAVTPHFSEIEVLAGRRSTATARIREIGQLVHLREEVGSIKAQVEQLAARRKEIESSISDHRPPKEKSVVIDEMSDTFSEVLRFLRIPWYTSGVIDSRDYLPRLDGNVKLEQVSVAGGTKTLVTTAYHLTLLTHALIEPSSLLPGLLVLDTPGKNLGVNAEDGERISRLFRRVRALIDAHPGRVQFIFAVNDLPLMDRGDISHVFSYERPLIEHLLHPGEDAVARGEVLTIGRGRDAV